MAYQFTQTGSEIQDILDLAQLKIAAPYDSGTSYVKGDYCTHEDGLFVANVSTTGTWNASKWTAVTVGDVLEQAEADISALNATLTQLTTTYTDSFTDSTTGITVSARKRGGVLQVSIAGQVTAPASWTVLGTLAENCRPSYNSPYTTLVSQTTSATKLLLSIYSNGQVRVNAGAGAISSVYFNAVAVFLTD